MKILYVSAFHKVVRSNNALRVESLRKLGHEVSDFDTTPYVYRFGKFSSRALHHFNAKIFAAPIGRALLKSALRSKPDLVWVDKGRFIPPEAIVGIKVARPDTTLVHYNPDDPFGTEKVNWSLFEKAIPYYNVNFIPNEVARKDYEERGSRRTIVFDRSFSPEVHRPVELLGEDEARFGADVGFIGSWAPAREAAIAHLIQSGIPVAVYGVNWEGGKHWRVIAPNYRGPSQWGDDYAKAICGMKIALHFLRKENRDEQDSRTFEIPACGSFMLAERSRAHERLFEEGKEAVFFDGFDDLRDKVSYYLANESKRERIQRAGFNRAISSGYDHASRLSELLQKI